MRAHAVAQVVRQLRSFAAGTVLALMAACSSTPRLSETPKAAVDLSGVWSSDLSRSDDVRTQLRHALEQAHAKSREVLELPAEEPLGGDPRASRRKGEHPPIPAWWFEEERAKREDLIATLTPASKLQIKQTDHGIVFSPLTGGAVRDLTPAERSTLFTSFATLHIACGWEGDTFYVESSDADSGLRTVERYRLSDSGKTLEESLQVEARHLKEQKYRVVYTKTEGQ
jgi:hypothetical protein